jgi:hypothetical protein
MSCCGQNREKARTATVRPAPASQTNQAIAEAAPLRQASESVRGASAPAGPATKLRYSGTAQIQVRGPRTGRYYVFSRSAPEAAVDRRDAEALMRMGLFVRGG